MSYDDEIAALKQQEAFATAQGRRQNALDARRRIAMLREERARAKHPDTAPASRSETADEDTSRVETATAADGDGRATKATARKRAAAKRRKTSDDG